MESKDNFNSDEKIILLKPEKEYRELNINDNTYKYKVTQSKGYVFR